MIRLAETIEVKSNLVITVRERGKIVTTREGHNIFLDLGREWLAKLIGFSSLSPDVPESDARIKYIGFGIGGVQQIALAWANSPPLVTPYQGTNAQDDATPTVTTLERPVRVSGGSNDYPGVAGDVWIGQVQAPPTHSPTTSTIFRRLFLLNEISYNPFLSVPLSEVMLFTSDADPESYLNNGVAYDTFDTISKTPDFEIEVVWTIEF